MKAFEIKINEEVYPCTLCMGAHLYFFEERGYDMSKADLNSTVDSITYLWALVKATCIREKKDFNLSLDEFAAGLDYEEYLNAQVKVDELSEGIAEKKRGAVKT